MSDENTQLVIAQYPAPICNHTAEIDRSNIGYTTGILDGDIPFEAEIWLNEEITALTVIMPQWIEDDDDTVIKMQQTRANGHEEEIEYGNHDDNSVLSIGMVDRGEDYDFDSVKNYVYFIEECGLISFTSENCNGAVKYLTDIEGNDNVSITITLEENGEILATTPLKVCRFPNMPMHTPTFKVVSGIRS